MRFISIGIIASFVMSALKLEVDIDTSKAKKGLQSLAKETSQSISMQQSRRQQKWQQNRQQQQQTTKGGSSNLLGLAALGTSLAALSKVSEKQSEKVSEATKRVAEFDRQIALTTEQLSKLGKKLEQDERRVNNLNNPNYYGTMASRKEYREMVEGKKQGKLLYEMGYTTSPMGDVVPLSSLSKGLRKIEKRNYERKIPSYREWAEDARDELSYGIEHARSPIEEAEYNFLKSDEKRLRTQRRSAEMSKIFWQNGGFGSRDLLPKDKLTSMQRLGLGVRDFAASKAMGFANMTRGIPLIGGMLHGAGASIAGSIGGISSASLGALGAGATVAGAVAAPLAAAGGSLLAGKKMVGDGRQAQDQISQLNASLGQLQFNQTGSKNVRELTDEIMKLSINGVNSVDDLNAATNALMVSFGGNSDEVKKWLPLIDDMAAATGVSASQMGEMIARVNESGVAESRVINSLSTKGIPIYRELGKVMGKSTEEAKKMAKAGEISASTFEKAMQRIGKSVKGTSEQLSSTTLAGAQSSWEAADSYAHKGAAEAYDRVKIASLNEMTEEAMKEASDVAVQAMRAAAGASYGAIESSVYEKWDALEGGIIDAFGTISIIYGGHNRATSNLNADVAKQIKDMENSSVELTEEVIDTQLKALRDYRKQLQDKLSITTKIGWDGVYDDTEREVRATMDAIDDLIARRTKDYTVAFEERVKQAEEAKKDFDEALAQGMEDAKRKEESENATRRAELDREFYDKILANPQNQQGLDMAYRGALGTLGMGITPENAKEKAGEFYALEHENPHLWSGMAERAEQIRDLMDAYEQATNTLKERAEEEKRRLEQEKRDRERTNLQFRAAMGDDAAKGELMLYDRAYELQDNPYLNPLEKEWMLEEEAKQAVREMASQALVGTDLGNGIYGTAKGLTPATTGYLTNVWGASCRTFAKFEKDYSKEQYNELKKTTQATQDTAKGINTLIQRFTISAQ